MSENDLFSVPEKPSKLGPVFRAEFDSECDGCGFSIDEGEEIRADGSGGFIHVECGDDDE